MSRPFRAGPKNNANPGRCPGLVCSTSLGSVCNLVDTLLALIKSFREVGETRRRETLARLDGLKWRPFEALSRD